MTTYQELLLEYISPKTISAQPTCKATNSSESSGKIELSLSPQDLAGFFVHTTFLTTALEYLREERWLHRHQITTFKSFVEEAFRVELLSVDFLAETIEKADEAEVKKIAKKAMALEKSCIEKVRSLEYSEQKSFATEALSLMAVLFDKEAKMQAEKKSVGAFLNLSLYRTFDGLDEIFGLDYDADHGMKTDLTIGERLYEGAGVGVQSSYSTLLNALRVIEPKEGARFIDLGSGYGRVGLVIGLMRPDIDFIGYEYVPHRVDIAEQITKNLGLESHVHFLTQDLADLKFKIPEAEVYYMYDPFSQETYKHVLDQLIEISKHQQITIVTKGNAHGWLKEVAKEQGWEPGHQFDGDSLSFFRSKEIQV